MASKHLATSSGSDMDDERKRRKLSNRDSARRSRMRKQQRLDELNGQVSHIEVENKKVTQMIDDANRKYQTVASDNNVLRAEMAGLTDRLRSLNSVLQIASEVSGLALDIPDIPDSSLEPWQLPCPIQPITTATDMLQS